MKIRSILIVALSGIGDALMFSPALRLLRESLPDARIDMLCMYKGAEELYSRNPDISHVLYWDFLHFPIRRTLKFLIGLRGQYDVTISVYPQNRWQYNIICFLLGSPIRLGHKYNHYAWRSLYFLNNRTIQERDELHNVEENLELVKLLNVHLTKKTPPLQVHLTPQDYRNAIIWLETHNLPPNGFFIGFHAGSAELKNHSKRRWAPEKYASLGKRLIEHYNATILLFGGPDELELNRNINNAMNGMAYIVQTPFMTTAALMKQCALFVCNDTGLMHVAAGLQLPIVTIFAYTNPMYVYPWKTQYLMVRHPLECSPCFYYSPRPARCRWKEDQYRCITHIDVDEVWEAVTHMISQIRK
ncbi:MAG: glycosyltransferase family 9 protein [Bacteroidetes bacterium]|nr:glycosyltransferase family 9 protein [Bacteroidota bacterium]